MVVANKPLKFMWVNIALLLCSSIGYALISIPLDLLFTAIFDTGRLGQYNVIYAGLYYMVEFIFVYLLSFLLLVFGGNILLFILKSSRIFHSQLAWCLIFGIIFLFFPLVLKLVNGHDYDNIGGYLEKYRTIKYLLVYFGLGVVYGLFYYRIMNRSNQKEAPGRW